MRGEKMIKMDVSEYNFEKVSELFKDASGYDFTIGKNCYYYGVKSVTAELKHKERKKTGSIVEGKDSGNSRIFFTFHFPEGQAIVSFYPSEEHCELVQDFTGSVRFIIEPIPQYLARQRNKLNYEFEEYTRTARDGDKNVN
jgi:hypothetical protein